MVPEWYLVIAALAALSLLGVAWTPLLLALPLLVLATSALAFEAVIGATRASFPHASGSRLGMLRCRATTALLYMLQPLARLTGRLRHGLAPWRRRSVAGLAVPRPRTKSIWSERWRSPEDRLEQLEGELRRAGCVVRQGGEYDRWDLQIRDGMLGAAHVRMAVEEHGGGRQLVRYRSWPRWSRGGLALTILFAALSLGAAIDGAWLACAVLGSISLLLTLSTIRDCGTATGIVVGVLARQVEESETDAAFDERSGARPLPWPERKAIPERPMDGARQTGRFRPAGAGEEDEGERDGIATPDPAGEQIPAPYMLSSRLHMMRREKSQ
jgi:O-antigen biosynthesis protein